MDRDARDAQVSLDEQVAHAMETDVRLLPLLPELLADLDELGTAAHGIVGALRTAGLRAGDSVLDLGCGKGAIAVALAEELGVDVEGIDGLAAFVEAARKLAQRRGVASRCRFRQGDLRAVLGMTARFDAVLLLGVGPVAGDYERTVAGLRTLVRPGGHLVIEDVFLAEGAAESPDNADQARLPEMRRRLTSSGDAITHEILVPPEETRAFNDRSTGLIQRRASTLRERYLDLAELIDEYVRRQEEETLILGSEVLCAIWTLRRGK